MMRKPKNCAFCLLRNLARRRCIPRFICKGSNVMRQEEELLFPFSDFEIDRLYTLGYSAGRCFAIGRENQTPLEAAEEAGWKRIHTFDTRRTVQVVDCGIGTYGDVIPITYYAEGLWAVNITAESDRKPDDL